VATDKAFAVSRVTEARRTRRSTLRINVRLAIRKKRSFSEAPVSSEVKACGLEALFAVLKNLVFVK